MGPVGPGGPPAGPAGPVGPAGPGAPGAPAAPLTFVNPDPSPVNDVAFTAPLTSKLDPSQVKSLSAFKVLAPPVAVIILLFALKFIETPPPKVVPSVFTKLDAVIIPAEAILLKLEVAVVLMPGIPSSEAVIVTAEPDIGVTFKFDEKLIVPAVPTVAPSCLMTTPEPEPTTPVNPDPSPIKDVAVTIPAESMFLNSKSSLGFMTPFVIRVSAIR